MKIDEQWVKDNPKKALDLPVKFATWRHNHPLHIHRELWNEILKWNNLKPPSIRELYQYWLDKIFKIE